MQLPGIARLLELQDVVDLPPSPTSSRRGAIRLQLTELIEHLPDAAVDVVMRDASVRNFLAGSESIENEPLLFEDASSLRDLVADAGVGYIVVHPPYSSQEGILNYIEESVELERFYERDGILGYRVVH